MSRTLHLSLAALNIVPAHHADSDILPGVAKEHVYDTYCSVHMWVLKSTHFIQPEIGVAMAAPVTLVTQALCMCAFGDFAYAPLFIPKICSFPFDYLHILLTLTGYQCVWFSQACE